MLSPRLRWPLTRTAVSSTSFSFAELLVGSAIGGCPNLSELGGRGGSSSCSVGQAVQASAIFVSAWVVIKFRG